jgi:hypothetical protein
MGGALIHAVSEHYLRQPISIVRAYRFAWKEAVDLVGVAFLAGCAIGAIMLIFVGIGAAFSSGSGGKTGYIFGAVGFCIVVYLMTKWSFIFEAALLEGLGPKAALSRSSTLVKGNWWRVWGIMSLLWIIGFIITVILGRIPEVGTVLGSILSTPVLAVGNVLLYYDLRVRKERYTLRALAKELHMEKPISRKKSDGAIFPLLERGGKRKVIILVFSFIIFCLATIVLVGIPAEYNLAQSIITGVQAFSAIFIAVLSVYLLFFLSKGFVQKIIAVIASVFILFLIGFVAGIPHKSEVAETDYVKDSGQQDTDFNAKDKNGVTALMKAALRGHTDIVQALLAQGADVNATDVLGFTILMTAAKRGHTDTVQALLAHGADVNAKAFNGYTAVMPTAGQGYTETVKALLAAGADVNAKDNKGGTALMWTAGRGHTETVKALLAAGADVNAKDNDGSTALMVAKVSGHKDIVRILKEAGAKE